MKDYATQIAAFETKRASLIAANEAIMEKAGEEGATLDAAQKEEFDGNETDVVEIDDHLKRLRGLQKNAIVNAKEIDGSDSEKGSDSRGGKIMVKSEPKLPPGIAFARLVKCLAMGQNIMGEAATIARRAYGEQSDAYGLLKSFSEQGRTLGVEKASVVGGATVSGNWAEHLVGTETSAFADFVEYLRPLTILGKFGQNGIPALRNVPFRVALVSQTAGGAAQWVGEGKPKPLTSFNFSRTTLTPLKIAAICVLTMEVIRDSSPAAETIVRDELGKVILGQIDTDFIDPTNSGTSGVKPASITNGAPHGAGSGTGDADDVRADVRSLLNEYIAGNNPPSSGVIVMPTATALSLSLMVNALGQREFNEIGMTGGFLLGIPVITSDYLAAGYVVMVNASDIYLGDEGGVAIDISYEASLQMLDNPTNDVVTPTATSLVSMFQTNSAAIRAERTINWARRRTPSVAYLSGVAWGGAVNDLS